MKLVIIIAVLINGIPNRSTGQLFLKDHFENPPVNYWPRPLWFWNNMTVDQDEVGRQMESYYDSCGYGGFGILPYGEKFKPEYLSELYFQVYGRALEKAKKLGVTMCLYDEFGFPSGSAGYKNADGIARFQLRYPGQTLKRLDKAEEIVAGPEFYEKSLAKGALMGIVAMDTVSKKCIDLTTYVDGNVMRWKVPEGIWKVMFFYCVEDGIPIVDYLDPESVRNFIQMTHEAYYSRFKEYFGSTINSTFFDEPTLYHAQGRVWTELFNKKFEEKYGFSPILFYPALWYDIGPETQSARNFMFGFRTELYVKGYTKEVNDWSAARGVTATGHQDQEEVLNPVSISGDLMKCFQYLDMPGIDKIGGNRPAERFYKIISSAAQNWDKPYVMSETYGAMDGIGWSEFFSIAMDQYSKGINMLIPHAVWYDNKNVRWKPELSHRNPLYADSIRCFNQFLARLNLMLQNSGRHVADIAVLYPIHTLQGEHYLDGPLTPYRGGVEIPQTDYVDVGNWLTTFIGKDYVFLHPEVLDEKCSINDGNLYLQNEVNWGSFRVIIIPSCKTILTSNLKKIENFYDSGGTVIFTTRLPSKSVEFGKDSEVALLVRSIFNDVGIMRTTVKTNKNGGNAVFIPSPNQKKLSEALRQDEVLFDVNYSINEDLRYIHKIVDGRDIFYFANIGASSIETSLKIRGEFDFEKWDPHTGKVKSVKTEIEKNSGSTLTRINLHLEPFYSYFLVSTNI